MSYKEQSDSWLQLEMLRVRKNMTNGKTHSYQQNKKYLDKLESEWRKRHGKT